jgi:hypothetical protein
MAAGRKLVLALVLCIAGACLQGSAVAGPGSFADSCKGSTSLARGGKLDFRIQCAFKINWLEMRSSSNIVAFRSSPWIRGDSHLQCDRETANWVACPGMVRHDTSVHGRFQVEGDRCKERLTLHLVGFYGGPCPCAAAITEAFHKEALPQGCWIVVAASGERQ